MRLMKPHARVLAALLGLVVALCAIPAAAAERTVVVNVLDQAGKAVAGAEVVVAAEREMIVQTDAQGQARFTTSAATVEVTVTANGESVNAKSAGTSIRVTMKGRS